MALKYDKSKGYEFSVRDIFNILWAILFWIVWFYLENIELMTSFLQEQGMPNGTVTLITILMWYIWKQYLQDNTK